MRPEEIIQLKMQQEYFASLKWLKAPSIAFKSKSERNLKKINQKLNSVTHKDAQKDIKGAKASSFKRRTLDSRVNFKQHLKSLVADNKIVKQLKDKINLQRLVIKLNEGCEETLKVDIERETLK